LFASQLLVIHVSGILLSDIICDGSTTSGKGQAMLTLKTERLVLRNFHLADWQALHEIISQYELSGLALYDQPWPTSPEEIRQITRWFASGDSYLAVCLKEIDCCIGFVALNRESNEDRQEYNLGYIFSFDVHGQGYATEACRTVLEYAFAHLQAQRVIAGTAAANLASCRLLERLGFRRIAESIGSFRDAPDGTPIRFAGYTFALTRAQWYATCQQT
jgi:RimJ/RimL family protein N-acetyltransferase